MKWAIVGSREFKNTAMIKEVVRKIIEIGECTEILTGDARGVDAEATRVARSLKLPVRVYRANWAKDGKRAGVIRNSDIVKDCDRVMAFWDGKSKGTLDTMKKARAAKKVVDLFQDHG